MRVLVVTNLYPNPWQPFRAPFNRHQLRILNSRLPVRVIAPIAWTDEWSLRRGGATPLPPQRRVELDGIVVQHPRYYFPPRIARNSYGHCFQWSISSCFQSAVAEFKPDVVLAPWAYPDGWAAGRLAHRAGLPVVVQVHGSDVKLLEQFPTRQKRTIESLTQADGVIAVSQDLAQIIQKMGVASEKLRVIYDGIDPEVFAPADQTQARDALGLPSNEYALLFIGNLVPVKAVDLLLQALKLMGPIQPNCKLYIIGSGAQRTALEQLSQSLGLSSQVRFLGAMPQSELPKWYHAADLFVLPSHSEGVPNVLLEASATGTPWVASRVGGIPEITHLGRHWLVTPNQPDELGRTLRHALEAIGPAKGTAIPKQKLRTEAVDELEAFLRKISHQESKK
jgi:glycosyltransferase involved in cell wall biosynthesis